MKSRPILNRTRACEAYLAASKEWLNNRTRLPNHFYDTLERSIQDAIYRMAGDGLRAPKRKSRAKVSPPITQTTPP